MLDFSFITECKPNVANEILFWTGNSKLSKLASASYDVFCVWFLKLFPDFSQLFLSTEVAVQSLKRIRMSK